MRNLFHSNVFLIQGLCVLLLSACGSLVPATTPPQLEHTPGVPITIVDERISTPDFIVDYPDGWRVIKTSVAEAPLEFVFASPDGETIITLATTGCPDQQATPEPEGIIRCVDDIYLVGQSDSDDIGQLRDIVDEVAGSIRRLDN